MFEWLKARPIVQIPAGLSPTEAAQWLADFEKAQRDQKEIAEAIEWHNMRRDVFGGGMR